MSVHGLMMLMWVNSVVRVLVWWVYRWHRVCSMLVLWMRQVLLRLLVLMLWMMMLLWMWMA